ncbi:MAG TPA: MCE family protein [Nocardia sp.]|uniref:MlaD family protein n=1 Tax=Nocardia sp. TaxID=1821 RepID=UPI002B4AFC27|nr:MCE family protein [Nocardia sp.]HLS77266.1 MCE family protein [Nocardia sp.]
MAILFDADGRGPTGFSLAGRGLALLLVIGAVVALLLMKSTGRFDDRVEVVAVLDQLGDGLPPRSDVKFRGLLVGTVGTVTPALDGGPARVELALEPAAARRIPATVTARVVPSNVFAVSSVQLVDNGPGPALTEHAEIPQDRSLSTVQLQTALTELREILAAATRVGGDATVGALAAVARATDRRGADIVAAGAAAVRITGELDALLAPGEGAPTLSLLAEAVRGLEQSAPDLIDALHAAVVPMRTFAEHQAALAELMGAGGTTLAAVDGALDRQAGRIDTVLGELAPVLDVFADGAPTLGPIVARFNKLSGLWFSEFYNAEHPRGIGKFQFRLTPHTRYTRADCPRYGELEGPSCATAPTEFPVEELPETMDPGAYAAEHQPGPDLPADLRALIERVLTGGGNGAEALLGSLLADGPFLTGGR